MLATDTHGSCPQRFSKRIGAPAFASACAAILSSLHHPPVPLVGLQFHRHRVHHPGSGCSHWTLLCLYGFSSSYLCSLGSAAVAVSVTAWSAALARSIAYRQTGLLTPWWCHCSALGQHCLAGGGALHSPWESLGGCLFSGPWPLQTQGHPWQPSQKVLESLH